MTQTAKILVTGPLFDGPCWYAVDEHGYPYLTSSEENAAIVTYEEYEAAVAAENPTISNWTWQGVAPTEAPKKAYCITSGIMPIIVYADTAEEAYWIFNERMTGAD